MLHGLFFMSVDSVYHGYSKIEKLINCKSKKREKKLVFSYYFSPFGIIHVNNLSLFIDLNLPHALCKTG